MPDINKKAIEILALGIDLLEGVPGTKGDKGDAGEKGADGKNGIDGKDGKDGIDGKDGKDGVDGKDGLNGKDGVDGKDGKDGVDGKDAEPITIEQVTEVVMPVLIQNVTKTVNAKVASKTYSANEIEGLADFVAENAAGIPTFETVSKNLKAFPNELNYTGENLTSIVYTTDLGTVTKTLAYTGANLTSITLSGDLPTGLVETVKTLAYTGENLTSITYA